MAVCSMRLSLIVSCDFSSLSPVAGADRGERPERCVGVASRHRQVENCLGVASTVATSGIHLPEIGTYRHRARRNRWRRRRRRRRQASRRVRKRTLSRGPSISPSALPSISPFSSPFSCLYLFLLLFRGHVDQLELPSEWEHQTRKFFLYVSLLFAPLRSWYIPVPSMESALNLLQSSRTIVRGTKRHGWSRSHQMHQKISQKRARAQKGNVRARNTFTLLNASRAVENRATTLYLISLLLTFSPSSSNPQNLSVDSP